MKLDFTTSIYLILTAPLAGIGFLSHEAFAAKQPLQSYPAIVEDVEPALAPMEIDTSLRAKPKMIVSRGGGHSKSDFSPLETERQEQEADKAKAEKSEDDKANPTEPAKTPKPTRSPAPSSSFESVPNEQAGSIVGRLKIIEKLILVYGRAYDYRTHTTQELKTILEHLEASRK